MKPFYERDGIRLYHGDCLAHIDVLETADVLVWDPPYGIDYQSGSKRATLAASIANDRDTSVRDAVLDAWGDRPALTFGTWRIPRPAATHTRLIWDTKGALGMGNLSVPWKPSDQEIYVTGYGFEGRRDTNVLTYPPVQSTAVNGRLHPHQKPVGLMRVLLGKCPRQWVIGDPTAGSGSTLVAAAELGRQAFGFEVDADYCEIAARRIDDALAQSPLFEVPR